MVKTLKSKTALRRNVITLYIYKGKPVTNNTFVNVDFGMFFDPDTKKFLVSKQEGGKRNKIKKFHSKVSAEIEFKSLLSKCY